LNDPAVLGLVCCVVRVAEGRNKSVTNTFEHVHLCLPCGLRVSISLAGMNSG
jgi:hypothetical protein